MEWVAFDAFEPIGTRVVPDILALLTALMLNVHRKPGTRPLFARDILDDPLLARRNTAAEEADRVAHVQFDYKRLRAERLAARASSVETTA